MRRTAILALALALSVGAVSAEAQTLKLGYINSQQILASAPGASSANDAFQQEVTALEAEATQLEEELVRMQQDLERQQLTLSPEAKRNREQQIQQKAQAAQARMAQMDQQVQQRRQELIQPVMDQISEVIEQIRGEGNYALILDVAAGSIIAADPDLDLTDEVLRRLQTTAAGPGEGA